MLELLGSPGVKEICFTSFSILFSHTSLFFIPKEHLASNGNSFQTRRFELCCLCVISIHLQVILPLPPTALCSERLTCLNRIRSLLPSDSYWVQPTGGDKRTGRVNQGISSPAHSFQDCCLLLLEGHFKYSYSLQVPATSPSPRPCRP